MYLAQWSVGPDEPARLSDINFIVQRIFEVVISAFGIVLLFLIINGGFKLLTSAGDPGKAAAAWKTITFAIVGIVLVISSYLILLLIESFTGVDLLEFDIIHMP